jgi:hypothetical protein
MSNWGIGSRIRATFTGVIFAALLGLSAGWGEALADDSISVKVNGTLAVGCAAGIITLPDIEITETRAGALRAGGIVALAAPYSNIAKFTVSHASLRAFRVSDGGEVTASYIGDNTLVADITPSSASNVPDVVFSLAKASNAESGPLRLVLSGLRVELAMTAAGDVIMTLGGAETSGSGLDTLDKIDSALGSGATRMMLKVGTVVSAACGYYPTATVTGPLTAQTIFVAVGSAGSDQGKQGSIFVAAILYSGYSPLAVYFLTKEGSWEKFTSCATAPAYFNGELKSYYDVEEADIPVVPTTTDLSALKGTVIYAGYGIPGKMSACENMLNNGTYSRYYEIR